MVVKDYPFAILDETMTGLSEADSVRLDMAWEHFEPTKRFATHWDRTREGVDSWLGIEQPVYTSYCQEDPHWTGLGWIERPAEQMIFRLSPFGGNSVREQTPVMSFWEEGGRRRELGVFVYDFNRWDDRQYGIWQPTPALSVYFRYTDGVLHFTYPLASGTVPRPLPFSRNGKGKNMWPHSMPNWKHLPAAEEPTSLANCYIAMHNACLWTTHRSALTG